MDEYELRSWANSFTFSEWDHFIEVAETCNFLQPKEIKLIRNVASSLESSRWPSAKQLQWAQSIIEKIQIYEAADTTIYKVCNTHYLIKPYFIYNYSNIFKSTICNQGEDSNKTQYVREDNNKKFWDFYYFNDKSSKNINPF